MRQAVQTISCATARAATKSSPLRKITPWTTPQAIVIPSSRSFACFSTPILQILYKLHYHFAYISMNPFHAVTGEAGNGHETQQLMSYLTECVHSEYIKDNKHNANAILEVMARDHTMTSISIYDALHTGCQVFLGADFAAT